ncbi:hypothetical protein ACFFRR_002157 [Megaselia abdita]
MVAGIAHPRPVIDVTVGIRTYEAFINMSIERSRINLEVLHHIQDCNRMINVSNDDFIDNEPIEFPVRRRHRQAVLKLEIHITQIESIILGMDYFMVMGFNFIMDRVSINQRSPVLTCPKTIDFIYNHPEGKDLREWLQENDRPVYREYKKDEQTGLQEEPRVFINNDSSDTEPEDADILQLNAEESDLNFE